MTNKKQNWWGVGFKPGMNFFTTPVPNFKAVEQFIIECGGGENRNDCLKCPYYSECVKYWDSHIAGGFKNKYYRDIPEYRAVEAVLYIQGLKEA